MKPRCRALARMALATMVALLAGLSWGESLPAFAGPYLPGANFPPGAAAARQACRDRALGDFRRNRPFSRPAIVRDRLVNAQGAFLHIAGDGMWTGPLGRQRTFVYNCVVNTSNGRVRTMQIQEH